MQIGTIKTFIMRMLFYLLTEERISNQEKYSVKWGTDCLGAFLEGTLQLKSSH